MNGQPLGNARLLQPLANVVKVGRMAEGFYATHGFAVVGEPFDEVGIPHVEMRRDLNEKIDSIQMRKKS